MRSLDFRLWKTGFIEVERPPIYFSKRRCPDRLRLLLTPPPLLYRAFGGDLERLVYHLEGLVEDGAKAIRDARPREPLGAQKLRRMHPWSEPRTMRESKADRVASYKIGAYDILGRAQDRVCRGEVTQYRHDHHDARIARRDGNHAAEFPYGAYAMRVYHGAPMKDAPAIDAMVAMPGPLLDEVRAELERDAAVGHAIVDQVRDALRVEAGAIVDDADLEIVSRSAVTATIAIAKKVDSGSSDVGVEEPRRREGVQVRHRFEKRSAEDAARIVTLRDRRIGRPRRHGSDPPV